jgi:5-deoxy-5-amino-3-dehydroquinate synthase
LWLQQQQQSGDQLNWCQQWGDERGELKASNSGTRRGTAAQFGGSGKNEDGDSNKRGGGREFGKHETSKVLRSVAKVGTKHERGPHRAQLWREQTDWARRTHTIDDGERQNGNVQTVSVPLGEGRAYDVHVGPGVRDALAGLVREVAPRAQRAAVVTQEAILAACPAAFADPGIEHRQFVIGPGEKEKSLSTIETLCRDWAAWGMNRNDVVIAVGGGMVTDVGGFAASCYHRGVSVIYVSTTLLGMIDAAIGGKTGVNLPEGKNLVGAYWQPSAVLCDLDLLGTMPPRELRSGLGEMAKYHFLDPTGGPFESMSMEDRVARCIAIKARVVAADEREGGVRAILNYGHTLAHALEIAGEFDVMHGEAVAIGLLYVAEVAHRMGRISAKRVAEHRTVVAGYDLGMRIPASITATDEELLVLMGRDKKALDGLTFVLDGPIGVEQVTGIDRSLLLDSFSAVR